MARVERDAPRHGSRRVGQPPNRGRAAPSGPGPGSIDALIDALDFRHLALPETAMALWYVIIGRDLPDALPRRLAARPAHLERLQSLAAQGRLLVAGPMPAIDAEDPGPAGFSGSLVVAQFEDLAAARAFADDDPYVRAGVYGSVEVMPLRKALP